MPQMCPNSNCGHDSPDNASICAHCGESLWGLLGRHTILEGRYRVTRVLGCGGMGAIYLADDTRIPGRRVAAKENLDTTPQAQSQFETEVSLMVGLDHPGLPKVSDQFIGPTGRQYLVMDYVEGETLEDVVSQRGPLPEAEVIALAKQLLDVLGYLHNHSIIHRDVKPANIKLTPGGEPVLVDFGIAKLHAPGRPTQTAARGVGSPGFAPIEQYGAGTDARSDLYSLGAVMYYLLTGQVPPEAPDLAAGARLTPLRKLRSDLSPHVQRVVFKAMALNPDRRYQSATEMRRNLLTEDDATWVSSPHTPVPGATSSTAPHSLPNATVVQPVPDAKTPTSWVTIVVGIGLAAIIGLGVIVLVVMAVILNRTLHRVPSPTWIAVHSLTTTHVPQVDDTPTPVSVVVGTTLVHTLMPSRTPQPSQTPTRVATSTPMPISTPIPASMSTQTVTPSPTTIPATPTVPTPERVPNPGSSLQGKLAFSLPQGTSYKVYVVEVGPTPPMSLYASIGNARQPALGHDGKWLLVNGTGGGIDTIARMTSEGYQATPVTCALTTAESGRPAWSPDDRFLAFDGLGADLTNPQIYIQHLDEVDCDLADSRLLVEGGYAADPNGLYPLWGPDDRIYFRSCATWDAQGASSCGIWSVQKDGSGVRQLTYSPYHLPTDVNRERLLFMFNDGGNWDVYSVGLKGGSPQNLTHHPGTDGWGTLSPDGRTIAFLSNRSSRWSIWLADIDGSNLREWLLINPDWGEVDPDRIGQERMSWSQ